MEFPRQEYWSGLSFPSPWIYKNGDLEIINFLQRGYNPVNQIVGYLISGDPGYISSFKDARTKMQQVDRAKVVEILLKEFRNKK